MAKQNRTEVLVGIDEEKRRFCDDFKDRKGCGQEVKIIKTASGKTVACEPVQLPCYDREGNTVWVWVPHYITCAEQGDYILSFMREKAEQNAEWRARKDTERGDRGDGPRRASYR